MEITISIPDKFVPDGDHDDISRRILEAYAIKQYRQETMSLGQISELLELSIDEANALLKRHDVPLNYDFNDMERDRRTIEMLLKK